MDKEREGPLGFKMMGGIRLAAGVRMQGIRPELLLGLMIVSDLCMVAETVILITSITDGEHMINSLHYTGASADFVTGLDVSRQEWVSELRRRLGPLFDVIDEKTHIHIEYQPHTGAVT